MYDVLVEKITANKLIKELKKLGNKEKAIGVARFFKSGIGQYGEGDKFLGITVPDVSKIAKINKNIGISEIKQLISSKWHEVRLLALKILVYKFEDKKISLSEKSKIYNFYLKNTKFINNWDLVDVSAPHIIGRYLIQNNISTDLLIKLTKSNSLWEKRISIISTYAFIKSGNLDITYTISDLLLQDKHDLLHKAVGWMLREAGKVDVDRLKTYIRSKIKIMPRTTLRYAIEKFDRSERQKFLSIK